MTEEEARGLLTAESAVVRQLLASAEASGDADRSAQNSEIAVSDAAQPLNAEGVDDAVVESLQQRLEVLQRAEQRLDTGTFGRSVLSGEVIPDDRLRADPAAELTIEEARAQEQRR
jgi:DnaK suppressor protein